MAQTLSPRSGLLVRVAAGLAFASVASAGGATREWATGADGSFHADFNWIPSIVPGTLDEANISRDGEFTVSFSQNTTTDRLRIGAGQVDFDLGGNTYSLLRDTLLSSSIPGLLISSGGTVTPSLTVRNGQLSLFSAIIGDSTGESGRLLVDGPGATVNLQNNLFLGLSGEGFFQVSNDATATTANAFVGTLGTSGSTVESVAGAFRGGVWHVTNDLVVGQFSADGFVTAVFDSTITAGRLIVGRSPGSEGQVQSAEGSLVHVFGDAILGGGGEAKLQAVGGDIIIGGDAFLGDGGDAELQANGGQIAIAGELSYDRRSFIVIENGGILDVGSIARREDALDFPSILLDRGLLRVRSDASTYDLSIGLIRQFSTVQVDGALELDDRESLTVGIDSTLRADSLNGNGAFSVGGGSLELGELILGVESGQRTSLTVGSPVLPSVLTVAGASQIMDGADLALMNANATFEGILINFGSLTIDRSDARFNGVGIFGLNGLINDADLTISDSTIRGEVIISENATVALAGDVSFEGRVQTETDFSSVSGDARGAATVTFNGGLEFGVGAVEDLRQVSINADVLLGADNTVVFEIAGADAGAFDAMNVTGSMALGGSIEIEALPGYDPARGDVFQLFTAQSIMGDFTSVSATMLANGLFWDFDDLSTGTIRVVPAPATALLLGLLGVRRRRGTLKA